MSQYICTHLKCDLMAEKRARYDKLRDNSTTGNERKSK